MTCGRRGAVLREVTEEVLPAELAEVIARAKFQAILARSPPSFSACDPSGIELVGRGSLPCRISMRTSRMSNRTNNAHQTESMVAAIAEATAAIEDTRRWNLEGARERLLRAVVDLDATMKELTDGE
jgi:hypothetical protein